MPYICLSQGVESLEDLVVEEILHAGPRLSRLPLPFLLGQDVQHLFQVGWDIGVCDWSFVI